MSKAEDGHKKKPETATIESAFGLLEGKWKCLILLELLAGTFRFNELRRRLPAITQKTLTSQLRDLERDGLIDRAVFVQVPVRVEYKISVLGKTLEPILRALHGWASAHGHELARNAKVNLPDTQMKMSA